ncbi:MAG: hypothetical protein HOQ03_13640 [Thermoleophilia bacterium]|nr:hypothetical protein [Thermoleophilia bacterium]
MNRILLTMVAGVLLALAAVFGRAEVADSAAQAAPSNQSPPAVSGTPEEGKTLTTSDGTWTGTTPISFAYSWRRCDETGGSCSQIGGATAKTYTLKKVDVGNTIRSRVTARNADGSTTATSVPSAVIRSAPAPATGCNGNAPIPIANVSLPDRLNIDTQSVSPTVIGRSTTQVTVRFRVACKGKAVQGALVLVEAVPFNQFGSPAEATTGADGWATVQLNRERGFPAARNQELLVIFARARKNGEDVLGGVSTRRLVSFPVDLRR